MVPSYIVMEKLFSRFVIFSLHFTFFYIDCVNYCFHNNKLSSGISDCVSFFLLLCLGTHGPGLPMNGQDLP